MEPWTNYKDDPIGYSENILGGGRGPGHPPFWWHKQQEIARALVTPPYRVLVKASHSVGKTHVVAGLINWWFDSFNPGIVLTTSPKYDQVKDVLWKEIRAQRRGRDEVFPGPKAPRMETGPRHYATGFTASRGEGAQGQHEDAVLAVIDEAVGVDPAIWRALESMVMGARHGFLAITNPTDAGSEFYRLEQMGGWHVITISAFEHPNIIAELKGDPPPYPKAIRLEWVRERIKEWCTKVDAKDKSPTDLLFDGEWYTPGPLAECRLLGRWPSQSGNVWSESLFVSCEGREPFPFPLGKPPEIGCDVARFGDDETVFHARWGNNSLWHENVNGWTGPQIVARLKEMANTLAAWSNKLRDPNAEPFKGIDIPVKVDADGMGGMGVVDWRGEYKFIGVSASHRSSYADLRYPNVRSELWFELAERARRGLLSFARLSYDSRLKIRLQALAPSYTLDNQGRRKVEPKDITKGRLGRSPDHMDAVNLAFYERMSGETYWADPKKETSSHESASKYGVLGQEDQGGEYEIEESPGGGYGFLGV